MLSRLPNFVDDRHTDTTRARFTPSAGRNELRRGKSFENERDILIQESFAPSSVRCTIASWYNDGRLGLRPIHRKPHRNSQYACRHPGSDAEFERGPDSGSIPQQQCTSACARTCTECVSLYRAVSLRCGHHSSGVRLRHGGQQMRDKRGAREGFPHLLNKYESAITVEPVVVRVQA